MDGELQESELILLGLQMAPSTFLEGVWGRFRGSKYVQIPSEEVLGYLGYILYTLVIRPFRPGQAATDRDAMLYRGLVTVLIQAARFTAHVTGMTGRQLKKRAMNMTSTPGVRTIAHTSNARGLQVLLSSLVLLCRPVLQEAPFCVVLWCTEDGRDCRCW